VDIKAFYTGICVIASMRILAYLRRILLLVYSFLGFFMITAPDADLSMLGLDLTEVPPYSERCLQYSAAAIRNALTVTLSKCQENHELSATFGENKLLAPVLSESHWQQGLGGNGADILMFYNATPSVFSLWTKMRLFFSLVLYGVL
jgi:hypothetical protein